MTDALAPSPGIALTREQKLAWLRLIRSENVGPATFRDLINHFGTASAAIEGLPELVARGRGRKRLVVASEQDARNELDRLEHVGGQLVCLGEPDYPASLRATEAPPPVLSVLGKKEILTRDVVAFVGSRNASLARSDAG